MPDVMNPRLIQQARNKLRGKVLLVEGDPQDLHHYYEFLRQQGCEVVACRSHEEALKILEVERFGLVVVCQGSCAFEGRCVLERAIEIDRHTPVLVLTRCLEMNCYLEAMQLGAVDYLEKPVPPEQIARVLETHLPRSNKAV